ncbi:MAG TPA: RNA methyltransferase [Phnomibacter sp.]|nr:RNA methyltransferase [Phnomibacter sp.]
MTPERFETLSYVLDHRQPDITLILENVFDPHNISAVMRTCDAVGIQEIYVLNTRIARHEKFGPRSSSSAAKWVTVHAFENVDECIQAVRTKYKRVLTTHLASDAVDMYSINFCEPIALVFGNEHSGCSPEIIGKCDGNFKIPQVGIIQSLNISVACAVTIYEAFRQKRNADHYNEARMPMEQRLQLEKEWKFDPRK